MMMMPKEAYDSFSWLTTSPRFLRLSKIRLLSLKLSLLARLGLGLLTMLFNLEVSKTLLLFERFKVFRFKLRFE